MEKKKFIIHKKKSQKKYLLKTLKKSIAIKNYKKIIKKRYNVCINGLKQH